MAIPSTEKPDNPFDVYDGNRAAMSVAAAILLSAEGDFLKRRLREISRQAPDQRTKKDCTAARKELDALLDRACDMAEAFAQAWGQGKPGSELRG